MTTASDSDDSAGAVRRGDVATRRTGVVAQAATVSAHERDLDERDYPEGDGKPMAETDIHRDVMIALILMLKTFFAQRPDVYVSGNLLVYYERNNPRASVAPDVFVTLGVPKTPARRVYFTWQEGRPPTSVVEVTSRSTRRKDLVVKRDIYARMGVAEYFLFDPLAEYLRPPLQGFRLRDGAYEPIAPSEVDGSLVSEQLGLLLAIVNGQLRLVDAASRQLVLTPSERAEVAELAAAQRILAERQRADTLQQALDWERERIAALEARLAELERLQREGRTDR